VIVCLCDKIFIVNHAGKFFKFKFDSTYPTQLNGIISDDEFQQSINRINRKISSNKSILLIGIVLGIGIIIGIILCIVGGITAVFSPNFGFPPTIGVGISFFIFGPIFFCIGCYIVQSQRGVRMRQTIAEESMKYSSRSPISCSWRLENSRHPVGEYGHYDPNHLVDHVSSRLLKILWTVEHLIKKNII